VILILLIVALIGLGFLLLRFLMHRAIRQVVRSFRASGALDPENAKTGPEMGLKSTSDAKLTDGIFKPRDYKPYVFDSLVQLDIIKITEDEKYYLSEHDLQKSKLADYVD